MLKIFHETINWFVCENVWASDLLKVKSKIILCWIILLFRWFGSTGHPPFWQLLDRDYSFIPVFCDFGFEIS